MSAFTAAYLVRLMAWGLAIALLEGPLVFLSWLAWKRALTNAAALQRYRISCAHFAAMTLLPALTLAVLHWTVAAAGASGARGSSSLEFPPAMVSDQVALRLLVAVALLWLAGTAGMVLRLVYEVRRIGKVGAGAAPEILLQTIHNLTCDWDRARRPYVRTADILVPQVAGLRRPVLRVPNDFLGLTETERNTVLLHELAHVARRDFGWNLLQRCLLSALWFQPAAWLLYRQLSSERESCCDDLAVEHGARPTDLARALVRLAENQSAPALAMAAASWSDLTPRIHNLLGQHPTTVSTIRHRALGLAASALCLSACLTGRLAEFDMELSGLCNASAFGRTISIDAHDPAGAFAVQIKRGRVIAASVEERLLPTRNIRQEGDRVTLLGAQREPLVMLTVTPQGHIQWDSRSHRP